ncbi:hypothetical protein [Novosphingobium sp.]|uniref:hypothetical protein n=1 Tax=Novosphingobium sp. TaxID=1874826 RepID=UPI003342A377
MGRSDGTGAASAGWVFTGWRSVAVVLFAGFVLVISASSGLDRLFRTGAFGMFAGADRGFAAERLVGQTGWERVTAVTPQGSAQRAGLTVGMRVRFDHPYESSVRPVAGRAIGLTADRDGRMQHVTIAVSPTHFAALPPSDQFQQSTFILSMMVSLILGPIAIVRGWGSVSALAFGIGIMGIGLQTAFPAWPTTPWSAAAIRYACAFASVGSTAMCVVPAALYAERIAQVSRGWITAFGLLAAVRLVVNLFGAWCALNDASVAVLGDGRALIPAAFLVCAVVGMVWNLRGWREADGADRSRFAVMAIAMTCMVWAGFTQAVLAFIGHDMSRDPPAVIIALVLPGNLLLPLALAYAVLRHRVVDLGFALNRTVVYGTFSVILLGSFGLIEWSVEHLLPEEWVKASAWIDAGAAVLVYLAFHRVHDWVEHRVEHLFFRQWQANEDALRRFVASAAHFEDARALARGFADELVRFGGEARVAVYRRNEGALDRVAGNWDATPRHFRDDDPAFALMRAERDPLDLGETSTSLPGVLALPMLDHGALAGLVLLDLKGNGALYRPDEVALLGWAAHEVGLALAALHAGLIETENRLLKAQLGRLSNIIGERLDRAPA